MLEIDERHPEVLGQRTSEIHTRQHAHLNQ
jgi:hypothetical protein